MSKTELTIYYDGPALQDSKMDIRELSPALLGLGDLLESANTTFNGDAATVKVYVKSFSGGCFGVDIELAQSIATQLKEFFAGDGVTATIHICMLLGLIRNKSTSLLDVLKKERGRKLKNTKKLKNGNTVLEYGDDDPIETSPDVLQLYQNLEVRKSLQKMVEPLEKDGIDSFSSHTKEGSQLNIKKQEVKSFYTPERQEQVLNDYEETKICSIVTLSFKESNKWRLNDGQNTINVTISDDDFIDKVNKNLITFSKGDLLQVRLRTIQKDTPDGLKTEYEVNKVEKRIKSDQLPLPTDEEEN